MTVNNLDLFAKDDVPEEGKEGEDCGKGGRSVNDGEGDVEDLDAVCKVANSFPVVISMSYHDDLVTSVD